MELTLTVNVNILTLMKQIELHNVNKHAVKECSIVDQMFQMTPMVDSRKHKITQLWRCLSSPRTAMWSSHAGLNASLHVTSFDISSCICKNCNGPKVQKKWLQISERTPILQDLIVEKAEPTPVMLPLWLLNGWDSFDHILVSLCSSNEYEYHSCHFCAQLDMSIVSCGWVM